MTALVSHTVGGIGHDGLGLGRIALALGTARYIS